VVDFKLGHYRTESYFVSMDIEQTRLVDHLRLVSMGYFLFVKPICDRSAGLNSRAFAVKGKGLARYRGRVAP
jgi:hypothetical protein